MSGCIFERFGCKYSFMQKCIDSNACIDVFIAKSGLPFAEFSDHLVL